MDTLHSGIADLDTASVVLPGSGSVEFNGIKYLDSLEVFAILSTSFSPFPITAIGFPVGLTDLSINSGIGAVTLGDLPQYLEDLSISSAPNGQISLNITAMPDTIQHFYLGNVSTITLGTLGYVADMFIMCDQLGPDPFSLPLLVVGRLNLSTVHGIAVDLSSITTDRLTILSSNIDGAISWPIGVTDLFLDAWFSVPVPAWPPNAGDPWLQPSGIRMSPPFSGRNDHCNILWHAELHTELAGITGSHFKFGRGFHSRDCHFLLCSEQQLPRQQSRHSWPRFYGQ